MAAGSGWGDYPLDSKVVVYCIIVGRPTERRQSCNRRAELQRTTMLQGEMESEKSKVRGDVWKNNSTPEQQFYQKVEALYKNMAKRNQPTEVRKANFLGEHYLTIFPLISAEPFESKLFWTKLRFVSQEINLHGMIKNNDIQFVLFLEFAYGTLFNS